MFYRFIQMIYFLFQKLWIYSYILKLVNWHPSNNYITIMKDEMYFSLLRARSIPISPALKTEIELALLQTMTIDQGAIVWKAR